ncbi:hypothetical protein FB567DRAFT_579539 [Paraphoma chrysanthemicola]|uniref:Uncharacterized protein n=1 Tax=Paraphoma chrysanthemicola TaxID=798071 RepID=A0A8K0R5K3_9PLEO|nr:hypothetical protein FB567DRAFT_579539 [Paraphoma chrysanthemicola]
MLPSNTPESFRFLNLPKELRLLVYEHIDRPRHHQKVPIPSLGKDAYITFITPFYKPPVPAIILVCRLVHDEAGAILKKTRRWKHHSIDVARIIIPAAYATRMAEQKGVISSIMMCLQYAPSDDFEFDAMPHVPCSALCIQSATSDMSYTEFHNLVEAIRDFAILNSESEHFHPVPRPWCYCSRVEILLEGAGAGPQMDTFLLRLAKRAEDNHIAVGVLRSWGGDMRLGTTMKKMAWVKDLGRLGYLKWVEHWL